MPSMGSWISADGGAAVAGVEAVESAGAETVSMVGILPRSIFHNPMSGNEPFRRRRFRVRLVE